MYVDLQENGSSHISESKPRFRHSQIPSCCLQPWRRLYNLNKKLPEYPQEEVTSPSHPSAHVKSHHATELCWFESGLSIHCEEEHSSCDDGGKPQILPLWPKRKLGRNEGLPQSAQTFKLSRASGCWQPHFTWEEIWLQRQCDFKANTPETQFSVQMLPPSCFFPLTPPLLQILGS